MRLRETDGAAAASVLPAELQLIYLDNQATTPTDPRVLQRMIGFLQSERVGNPHSEHHAGRMAAAAVEQAREQIATLIGALPEEIFFTSGATEANNIAIQGLATAPGRRGNHIVTCTTEHKCVLECVQFLSDRGYEATVLPVGDGGLVDVLQLERSIRADTALVSIMSANNEIGVVQPIAEIAAICKAHGVVFHTDGAQAVGKIPFDVAAAGVDMVSISGHKLYAPIGIGALFVSESSPVRPEPLFRGGGQERGLRSGTVPAHLAVAMGVAAEIAKAEMDADAAQAMAMRDRFLEIVAARVPAAVVNGWAAPRIPGNLSITFPGIDADRLVSALQPHIAISTNSACSSGVLQPSHVLLAIGLSEELADSTIRIGFGRLNTIDEVQSAAETLCNTVAKIGSESAAA